ncbi:hypothetical protein BA195_06770 [Tenacibaculum soleae]|uniref:Peptidase U35 n=1 Tax=Tenacibaculum soleae TaxID=447689 RepID=A0A1B9Y3H9_9FLAO|nr:hypothetical protein [Tenacibaculum soleae]OCK44374.1 hypothetical protein BA195_06770 [Tenacibaculum soleae]
MSKQIVTREAFARSTAAELLAKRQVEFVISSESVDTYSTVFKQDGADLSRYAAGGIVLYMHDSFSGDEDNILGRGEVFKEGAELIGRVTFEPREINEKADKIFRKIENGTPFMASIGARVIKAELGDESRGEDKNIVYFRAWQLLEFSVVPVGSNPDAHKRNAETLQEIRTSLVAEIPVIADEVKPKRNVREAQLIINGNRK